MQQNVVDNKYDIYIFDSNNRTRYKKKKIIWKYFIV